MHFYSFGSPTDFIFIKIELEGDFPKVALSNLSRQKPRKIPWKLIGEGGVPRHFPKKISEPLLFRSQLVFPRRKKSPCCCAGSGNSVIPDQPIILLAQSTKQPKTVHNKHFNYRINVVKGKRKEKLCPSAARTKY